MKRFRITFTRTASLSAEVEIDAGDEDEAMELAWDQEQELDYTEIVDGWSRPEMDLIEELDPSEVDDGP